MLEILECVFKVRTLLFINLDSKCSWKCCNSSLCNRAQCDDIAEGTPNVEGDRSSDLSLSPTPLAVPTKPTGNFN